MALKYEFLVIILTHLNTNFVISIQYECNANEFLHAETGLCTVCTLCDYDLGLVTWIKCTNESDTLCGPKFRFPMETMTKEPKASSVALEKETRLTEVKKWVSIQNIMIGVLIGVGLTAFVSIATTCILQQRGRRQARYRVVHKDEIKSLKEIAYERNIAREQGNIYIKPEDIRRSRCTESSPV